MRWIDVAGGPIVHFSRDEVEQLMAWLHDGAASDTNVSTAFYLLLQDFVDKTEP